MKKSISRYNFNKQLIANGELEIIQKNSNFEISYKDTELELTATAPYHPLTALENLRIQLETKESYINCMGCRIDTSYRPTGGYGTYIIETGIQATNSVNLFEPTSEIDKLCKVSDHQENYLNWIRSLGSERS